jgi:hypothetical protein
MNQDPRPLIYYLWQRLGKTSRVLLAVFSRPEAPVTRTCLPAAMSAADAGTEAEDLPPEPAWVELSRSSWL